MIIVFTYSLSSIASDPKLVFSDNHFLNFAFLLPYIVFLFLNFINFELCFVFSYSVHSTAFLLWFRLISPRMDSLSSPTMDLNKVPYFL